MSSAVRRARTRSELTTTSKGGSSRKAGGRPAGLLFPSGRERRIGPALPASVRVPHRLGVAEEQQSGHAATP